MVREGERGWKMGDLRDKGFDPRSYRRRGRVRGKKQPFPRRGHCWRLMDMRENKHQLKSRTVMSRMLLVAVVIAISHLKTGMQV